MAATAQSCFSIVNGIEHYDNGESRIWRCPRCEWWQQEDADKCPVCATRKDGSNL